MSIGGKNLSTTRKSVFSTDASFATKRTNAFKTIICPPEKTQAGFRGFLECLDDSHEKGVIYGTGAWKIGDIKGKPALTDAFNAGKNI